MTREYKSARGRRGSFSGTAGFLLGLGPGDDEWSPTVRAALAAVGMPTAVSEPEDGGPAFRIAGRRRLTRLAELVGERPSAAPPEAWPIPT